MSVGASRPDGWDAANRLAHRLGTLKGLLDAIFANDEKAQLTADYRAYRHYLHVWATEDETRKANRSET